MALQQQPKKPFLTSFFRLKLGAAKEIIICFKKKMWKNIKWRGKTKRERDREWVKEWIWRVNIIYLPTLMLSVPPFFYYYYCYYYYYNRGTTRTLPKRKIHSNTWTSIILFRNIQNRKHTDLLPSLGGVPWRGPRSSLIMERTSKTIAANKP